MIFIFTIATEWDRTPDTDKISVKNIDRLHLVHDICISEGVRPTYLCSYEVAVSDSFKSFGESIVKNNEGEIGSHLHPWSTPPYIKNIDLKNNLCPFPNEYPLDVFESKLLNLKAELENRFCQQTSYRAGRFGFVSSHANILKSNGYLIDSSVTPFCSWSRARGLGYPSGPDYRKYDSNPFYWQDFDFKSPGLLELPISIFSNYPKICRFLSNGESKFAKKFTIAIRCQPNWLRPFPSNLDKLISIANVGINQGHNVLCMMMHSNELHPYHNPYFTSEDLINRLLFSLKRFFRYVKDANMQCHTLSEFARTH